MEQNINLNLFRSEFLGTQLLLNGTLLLPTPTDVIFAPPPYSCRVLRKWMRRIRRHSSIYSYRLSDSVSRFHVWIRSRSTYGLSTVYSRSAYVPLTVHLRSTYGPPTVHLQSTNCYCKIVNYMWPAADWNVTVPVVGIESGHSCSALVWGIPKTSQKKAYRTYS